MGQVARGRSPRPRLDALRLRKFREFGLGGIEVALQLLLLGRVLLSRYCTRQPCDIDIDLFDWLGHVGFPQLAHQKFDPVRAHLLNRNCDSRR